jgi:hypothetical protein
MFEGGISSIGGINYSTYARSKANNIYSIVNGKSTTNDGSQWIFVQYDTCPDKTSDPLKGPKLYMVKCSVFNDGYTSENLGCPANGKWPVTSKLDSRADLISQVDKITINKTFHTYRFIYVVQKYLLKSGKHKFNVMIIDSMLWRPDAEITNNWELQYEWLIELEGVTDVHSIAISSQANPWEYFFVSTASDIRVYQVNLQDTKTPVKELTQYKIDKESVGLDEFCPMLVIGPMGNERAFSIRSQCPGSDPNNPNKPWIVNFSIHLTSPGNSIEKMIFLKPVDLTNGLNINRTDVRNCRFNSSNIVYTHNKEFLTGSMWGYQGKDVSAWELFD